MSVISKRIHYMLQSAPLRVTKRRSSSPKEGALHYLTRCFTTHNRSLKLLGQPVRRCSDRFEDYSSLVCSPYADDTSDFHGQLRLQRHRLHIREHPKGNRGSLEVVWRRRDLRPVPTCSLAQIPVPLHDDHHRGAISVDLPLLGLELGFAGTDDQSRASIGLQGESLETRGDEAASLRCQSFQMRRG